MARRKTKTSAGLRSPKSKVNITITPESKATLETIAGEMGLSKSAFFEGILNGSISLSSQKSEQLVTLQAKEGENSEADKALLEVSVGADTPGESSSETTATAKDDETISKLEEKIAKLENDLKQSSESQKDAESKLKKEKSTIAKLEKENTKLKTELDKTSKVEQSNNSQAEEQASVIANLKKENGQLQNNLEKSHQQAKEFQSKFEEQKNQINHLIKELEDSKQAPESQPTNADTTPEVVNNKQDDLIEKLNQEISQLEQMLATQQKANDDLTTQSVSLQTKVQKQNSLISSFQQQIQAQSQAPASTSIANSNSGVTYAEVSELNNTIDRLQKRISELETVASIGSQTLNKWRTKVYNF